MKRNLRALPLIAGLILLSACGRRTEIENPIVSEPPSVESTTEATSETLNNGEILNIVIEDDTTPPEEGMVRSPLTNEWVSEQAASIRPIAVMTPNENSAIPHYNLSEASIIYEANVEGRMTRMMAIYEDWIKLRKIGNIRSLRTYFTYWAFEWDAFIVHVGGPFYINDLLEQPTTETIDQTAYADSSAFFADTERSKPHNTYCHGVDLLNAINENGYSLEDRGLTDGQHFRFAPKVNPNILSQYGDQAKSATYIDMSGCYPLTRSYFEYNEDDGLYYRSQHLSEGTDGPHIDGATGEQLAFKNIIIQNTYYEEMDDGYLVFQCHDNTRDGWFFTNGKGIHITWEKTSDYSATRYYDDNGEEIILNTGKTMICIVEDGDNFAFH